jgi:hypothetical protein
MGDLLKKMDEEWSKENYSAKGYSPKKLDIQLTDKENDFRLFVEDTLRRSGAIPDYTSIAMTIQLMRGEQ